MTPLRDIVARFAIAVDTSPVTEADRALEKLKSKIRIVGTYGAAAFAGLAYGAWDVTQAASHANEALNVLKTSFGSNAGQVVKWSEVTSKEMGRSLYDIQDWVGQFGAFLQPMFKGTTQEVDKMSERLVKLAIDLSSFYDTSEAEAFMRLKSGLSGETEAVRRLGIDISDKSLQELNIKKGGGSYASLTLAQKTALRFEKILQDTALAQGDAVKTAGDWANSLRRVQSQLHDMKVNIGKALLPDAIKLLKTFEGMVLSTTELVRHLKPASILLAGMAISLAAMATAAAMFSVSMLPVLLALEGFLILEDIIAFFTDANSVTGQLVTALTGVKRPLAVIEELGYKFSVWAHNTMVSYQTIADLLPRLGAKLGYGAAWIAGNTDPNSKAPTLTDPNLKIRDADAELKAIAANREQLFQLTVKMAKTDADLDTAVSKYGNWRESDVDERKRAFEMRRKMVESGDTALTPADLAAGFGAPFPVGTPMGTGSAPSPAAPYQGYTNPAPPTYGIGNGAPMYVPNGGNRMLGSPSYQNYGPSGAPAKTAAPTVNFYGPVMNPDSITEAVYDAIKEAYRQGDAAAGEEAGQQDSEL